VEAGFRVAMAGSVSRALQSLLSGVHASVDVVLLVSECTLSHSAIAVTVTVTAVVTCHYQLSMLLCVGLMASALESASALS
jgi:hypothetical protein